ncbi:DUF438 domain-containing protein [Haloplasma contractile]|uniref:PAS-PAC sensor protein n=1 Tax=Haloplasma contractile SSD-17B TaxID=1033810 RepID=U2E9E2_9MOLU|nr:DUF438 domain-containing protein [Haloplasma contractile]ERJ11471.1 Putative PAS-PAC sensor protein [Haloplasma contractile SSD-17B]
MSEFINNREFRQKKLKQLIMELHEGKNPDDVKEEFKKYFDNVSSTEISDLEQSLIMEGMPVEDVQRLCDVHASVFKGSIEDIHGEAGSELIQTPGHPLNVFKQENDAIKHFLKKAFSEKIKVLKQNDSAEIRQNIIAMLRKLYEIDRHYLRKENLLFPYLEKYGITGPPKVMWGVDDEIRENIKTVIKMVEDQTSSIDTLEVELEFLKVKIDEMVFKEESILFPMTEDTLTQDEWLGIQEESDDFGYTFIEKPVKWIPPRFSEDVENDQEYNKKRTDGEFDGNIRFETGILSVKELELLLDHLPFDITFIDKGDVVKYFSHGERIFPRTKAVIGRTVQNCHPPSSVHVVNKMVEDFKSGKKDSADFWINMKGMLVYIRYFAVKDEKGDFMGSLEVTQNIKPFQAIKGEKRILDEDE